MLSKPKLGLDEEITVVYRATFTVNWDTENTVSWAAGV